MRAVSTIAGLSLLLSGCFGNEASSFPEGLEPLEENGIPPASGTAVDPFPEERVVEGHDGGRYDTVFARVYVRAPIVDVWDALRDPEVGTDRRSASEWTVEVLEDEAYDTSFVVHCTTYEIVTVDWWTTWRQGVVEGTAEAPEVVAIRWQKTEGSTILRVIEGSIVLRAVGAPGEAAVTELDFVYHADALGAGLDQYVLYVHDVLDDVLAHVAGEPLPPLD